MKTNEFHLGDVLSITTHRLVSPRHIAGVYDILNFMTGDELWTHQLPDAGDECRPYLVEQFPELATPEMDLAVAELDEILKTANGKTNKELLVANWLAKQVSKYGKTFTVKPIPNGTHEVKGPFLSAIEVFS